MAVLHVVDVDLALALPDLARDGRDVRQLRSDDARQELAEHARLLVREQPRDRHQHVQPG